MKKNLLLALVVLVAAVVVAITWRSGANAPITPPEGNSTSTQTSPSVTQVKVALIALDDNGAKGKKIGCNDSVVYATRQVASTTQPLNAAFKELFSLGTNTYGGLYNVIHSMQSKQSGKPLQFDHATLENGVAKVYLTGDFGGLGGVCDDPRVPAQLEETARQFSTVQSVEVYLEGQQVDWSKVFSMQ